MSKEKTVEPQYQDCLELRDKRGLTSLGVMTNQVWHDDPKRLVFVLARYKFVAKMLMGKKNVLEVGCADAFGTRIVCQEVEKVTAVDFDPAFVADCRSRMDPDWPFEVSVHDMLAGPVTGSYDAAYAMDVLEHIEPAKEALFLANVTQSLTEDGVLILGSPSLQSQSYASPQSKAGHVNCKDGQDFKKLCEEHFKNVFLFSMNDEVVHTGFSKMAHYLITICCGTRR